MDKILCTDSEDKTTNDSLEYQILCYVGKLTKKAHKFK